MVDQLNAFASEVSRVAREVGTEGKLGGQAAVAGVAGTWKDLTDNVNSMANNLTSQVRNIAEVTIAVANGDLSKKITVDTRGEILELKETINTMVDQLRSFAAEVSRVAREVGTDGKLGGQAQVPGVAGTWKDLTDNVNSMASNLTGQVRNIADVATAIARGDLNRKITVDVKGEILQLKETINTMVEQLSAFASEVTRVAREVGTEGKLGGQAAVPGVAGTWKDLTDNVNSMASNLTGQVRNIAEVTIAVANGDLSKKITVDVRGEILQLKETINTMVEQLRSFASEVTRVAREVGTEGRLGVQAVVPGVAGTWKDLTDSVNTMGANLTAQVRNIAEVTTAVARGDLNRKITVDVKGEILELKNTINTMVDQLNSFANEVTRVAREVGTEGKLGGQAQVGGVGGTWKDLTDNVNFMASNLTEQVRGIVKVVTAVANGNLSQRLTVQAKGEVAALADTINNMTDTLATFADQVTNVAREVGVEGRLGGQANVPGAAGTWKDLTGNVNLLAANLTTQVRAIAEVATAVTKGDLTRSIQVETRGEVAQLKDNINTMISNLRETTESNREQDWLKTNLAKFTGMLQGQRELNTVGQMLLSELAPLVHAQQGAIYHLTGVDADARLNLLCSYATSGEEQLPASIRPGQGLAGQCALEKKGILLTDVPPDFVTISSSLGRASNLSVIVLPVLFEGQTKAVIELATLNAFTPASLAFLELLTQSIGVVFNTIEATMRTEGLLKQSQQLTVELQSRQAELQETNEQLASKAKLLAEQNAEVERKSAEVEQARRALEEKAEELALTSKYKSEFLANMSHELRTPLNSILILSQQLAGNPGGNLTPKQIEFSRNINSSGSDLLNLINDILDLSKIESGTVTVEVEPISFGGVLDNLNRSFRHVAEAKNLPFRIEAAPDLPRTIDTDSKRLQQILKNLLSNAVKFTTQGHVELRVGAGRARLDARPSGAAQRPHGGVVRRRGHRHRRRAREAAPHLRSVPAGRRRHLAQVRRHRPRPGDQPRAGRAARRRDPAGQRAGRGQHVHPLPAAPLRRARQPQGAAAARRRGDLARRAAARARRAGGRRPRRAQGGRADAPHHRGRPALRAGAARDGARQGLQGPGHVERGARPVARAPVPADGDHARHLPARHARLDGAQQPEARSGHAPHPGADHQRRRGEPPRPVARRVLVPGEVAHHRRPRGGVQPHRQLHGAAHQAAARRRGQRPRARVDRAAPRPRRHRNGRRVDRPRGARDHEERRGGLRGARPAAARHDRLRAARAGGGRAGAGRRAGGGLHRQGPEPRRGTAAEVGGQEHHPQGRAVARAPARRNGALPAPSSSPSCPTTSSACWSGCTGPNEALRDRKILIVDDDARNIFALTSLLENQEMDVISSTNGRGAIEIIQNTPDLSIVLMDIMMPEMDGYETIREIRKMPQFRTLPILALTARAMKGDREKCLDAGASDYIAKPVNTDQLLSLMRVWLFR